MKGKTGSYYLVSPASDIGIQHTTVSCYIAKVKPNLAQDCLFAFSRSRCSGSVSKTAADADGRRGEDSRRPSDHTWRWFHFPCVHNRVRQQHLQQSCSINHWWMIGWGSHYGWATDYDDEWWWRGDAKLNAKTRQLDRRCFSRYARWRSTAAALLFMQSRR